MVGLTLGSSGNYHAIVLIALAPPALMTAGGWLQRTDVMPKMKSNRAASKRFRKTAGGKVKRNSAFRRHILTSKSSKRKRQLRAAAYVAEVDIRELQRLLPY